MMTTQQKNRTKKCLVVGVLLCALVMVNTSQADDSDSGNTGSEKSGVGGEAGSGGGASGFDLEVLSQSPMVGYRVIRNRMESGSYSDSVDSCTSAIEVLHGARQRALLVNGNNVAVRRALVSGLSTALREIRDKEKPLTKLALERGLVLDSQFVNGCKNVAMGVTTQQCLDLELRTSVYFLDKFYSYILDTVYPLDRDYWIPYQTRCRNNCHDRIELRQNFIDDFYVAYKDSALALLNFYVGDGDRGMPDALAKDVYELHLAENIFQWSADDLNYDLFRREFAVSRASLQAVALDLAEFNAGNTTEIFRNSSQAVLFSRQIAQMNAEILSNSVNGPNHRSGN